MYLLHTAIWYLCGLTCGTSYVINSFDSGTCNEKKQDLMNTFDELEKIWEEYDVYEKVNDENEG